MMSAHNILQSVNVDIDGSPVCKRARYDINVQEANRWTLSKNELILHSVYDSGVDRLVSDSEFDLANELKRQRSVFTPPVESPTVNREQIAVLEASLPENTLQKLSLGEFDIFPQLHSPSQNLNINYFDRLSDEVILNIFQNFSKSQLGNVALVCKRFSQLVEDESLWTRMDVSRRTLEPGAMGTIMSRQVIILRLARTRVLSPPILPNVKAAQPEYRCRLMYLDLTMASIAPSSLAQILRKCRRLKKLSLESVTVSDGVFQALSENNRELEVLNLAMAVGVHLTGLEHLFTYCRKLKELNLAWTYLSSNCINFICKNLPATLDRFNFAGCRKFIHDENVVQIVKKCPNLRELDLSDCTAITGEAVKNMTVLNELNFLSLSRCYLIPYRSLMCLKEMKSLAYLDVHGINPDELKLIKDALGVTVNINKFMFSSVARPTVGTRNSSKIWNMRVRD